MKPRTNNDNNFLLQRGRDRLEVGVGVGVSSEESSPQGKLLCEPFSFKTTCVTFITDKHAQIQHAEKSRNRDEIKWRKNPPIIILLWKFVSQPKFSN